MKHSSSDLPRIAVSGSSIFTARHFRLCAIAFFLLMVGIGSLPGNAEAMSAVAGDKTLHFSAYAFLSLLVYCGTGGSAPRRAAITVMTIGMLGLTDETIQYFLPYRNPELADWISNMLAAALTVTALVALHATAQRDRKLKMSSIQNSANDRTN